MDPKVDPSTLETVTEFTPGSSTSTESRTSSVSEAEEGRFLPGTLLGGRYRIISLLGRGGMGEVYRGADLTLGQSVALKFLPEEATKNQRLLERFHGEVRVARQVSHPNVCRVYDIGEAEGLPFISMEYIDGEDLGSLLLRIGRLPADKALETARKICAGLAAAHDKGVIHRDLKPHNIMMNKRGEVMIMDFGLAAIASQLSGYEARHGTPAYMAPEQLKGHEVSAKSDIYALGLVLYELFTGKKPYEAKTLQNLLELQESAQLTSMTSIAADIDPAVEKAIRRCLDPDPARRPGTALAVSAALPGGDPLAAALAAGETPSPELVAASGETAGLPRKYSVPCLAVVLLCLFGSTLLWQRNAAIMRAPLDYPPDALSRRAREIAATLGFAKKPADSVLWLEHRRKLVDHLNGLPEPRKFEEWLAAEAPIAAVYRESTSLLIAEPFGLVSASDPAPIEPGMVQVSVDGHGRLLSFSGAPYKDEPIGSPVLPEAIFRSAGLEMSGFVETAPEAAPRSATDQLRAWKGPHPKIPNTELLIEVGSWKGRVTHARIAFPWERGRGDTPSKRDVGQLVIIFVLAAGMLFALLLARRNWRLGRTDRKGALRIASARFLLALVTWTGRVHAVPHLFLVFAFFQSAGDWLLSGALVWLLYLALEPALRARWPHSIVTWNRLLAGRWLDPQVGSHILIGAMVGSTIWVAAETVGSLFGSKNTLSADGNLFFMQGTRQWIAGQASILANALTGGLSVFLVIFGLRMLLRKDLLAAIATSLLFTFVFSGALNSSQWQLRAAIYIGLYAVLMFVLLRCGLVATLATMFFINDFNTLHLGTDWTTWYAPSGFASVLLLAGIALFAFWRSLGSQELLSSD